MHTRQYLNPAALWHDQPCCGLTVRPAPLCPQLLTAPLMEQRAATMHSVLAALASPMLPGSHLLIPASVRGRCRALLLLMWATLGWLLPTLALLPMEEDAVAGQREGQAGEAAAAAAPGQAAGREQNHGAAAGGPADTRIGERRTSWVRALVSALRPLQPSAAADVDPWAPQPTPVYPHPRLLWVLRWWVLISVVWAAACVAVGN